MPSDINSNSNCLSNSNSSIVAPLFKLIAYLALWIRFKTGINLKITAQIAHREAIRFWFFIVKDFYKAPNRQQILDWTKKQNIRYIMQKDESFLILIEK